MRRAARGGGKGGGGGGGVDISTHAERTGVAGNMTTRNEGQSRGNRWEKKGREACEGGGVQSSGWDHSAFMLMTAYMPNSYACGFGATDNIPHAMYVQTACRQVFVMSANC